MSRSYRRGYQCAGDKWYKKHYNRKLRRNKNFDFESEAMPRYNSYKKENCPWNISDYRFGISWEKWKRWNSSYYDSEEEMWKDWQRYRNK